jgi:hypothetical protein
MSLFGKLKSAISGRSHPIHAPLLSFAAVPAAKMSSGESPFDNWRAPEIAIPAELESSFKGTVWMYQLFMFQVLVSNKLGAETASAVLDQQEAFLDALAPTSGTQMRAGMDTISKIILSTAQTPFELDVGGRKVPFPAEYAVAYAMLPDLTWAQATALAKCLEHGKQSAWEAFEPFVNSAGVENGSVVFQVGSNAAR